MIEWKQGVGLTLEGSGKKWELEQRWFDPSSVLQWIRECAGSAAGRLMPCSPPKGRTGRKGGGTEGRKWRQLQAGAQVKSNLVGKRREFCRSSGCRSYACCSGKL